MKKSIITTLASVTLLLGACSGEVDQTKEETELIPEESQDETAAETPETDSNSGASEEMYATDPDEVQDSYDVVVVGSGGAGLAAAISAHDAGASVAVFEKMPVAGGNTNGASAGMNASETIFQEAEGIEDSKEKFFEESLEGGKGTNDQELLRYLTDNAAAGIEWLDSLGITLNNLTTTGGMSVPRAHRPEDGSPVGEYLVDGLIENLSERDIPLFLNSEVNGLMQEDGVVTGIDVAVGQTNQMSIQAKSTIITTGGFGASPDMLQEFEPDAADSVTTNHEGATGDGIKMAQEIGADVVDMEHVQVHPTVDQTEGFLITEAVRGEGAILVNQKGERFFNELDTRDAVSEAIQSLDEGYSYLIVDQALRERVPAIDFYESQGLVQKGETLAKLAEEIDVDAETLEATVTAWNEHVQAGEDPDFGRETGMEHQLSEALYYAIKIAPGVHHTMGGLRINTETAVLDEAGEAIPGLYAAGEVTGGIHGQNRIGGNAVADIIVFGRHAGEEAAK